MHLVEDDEGGHLVDENAVHEGLRGDLRIGDGSAVEGPRDHAGGVAEGRIEADADAVRRVGPLPLEVLGGGHARRSAKVVLPAPGVAAARKSRGSCAKYASSASACQARNRSAVPRAARSG